METYSKCNLQDTRYNKYNHELPNTHLAVNIQYCSQQCRRMIILAVGRSHLQSNGH